MNKLFKRVAVAVVGMAMAIGVGVAVGKGEVKEVRAADIVKTVDFTSEYKGISTSVDKDVLNETTDEFDADYTFYYMNAYKSSGYLMLGSKAKKSASLFSNKTAIPGDITKITVTPTSGCSGSAAWAVSLGSSEFKTALTAGGANKTSTGASAFYYEPTSSDGLNYFAISSTSTSYNAQVASISISYKSNSTSKATAVTISGLGESTKTNKIVGETVTLTAEVSVDSGTSDNLVTWESSDHDVATINSNGVVTFLGNGTTSITATSHYDAATTGSNVGSVSLTLSGIKGIETNPITVAEANTLLANSTHNSSVYYCVSGIISSDITDVSGGQISFDISDDGTATNELNVFKIKYLNNESFTSKDQVAIGDSVVVSGKLTVYNEINELQYGYVRSISKGTSQPTLSVSPSSLSLEVGAHGALTATLENATDVENISWSIKSGNQNTISLSATKGASIEVTGVAAGTDVVSCEYSTLKQEISVTVTEAQQTGYTVSFNLNGGTNLMDPVPNIEGDYTLPECTMTPPDGKVFRGWKVNNQGVLKQPGDKITVSADVTLYPIWANPAPTPAENEVYVTGTSLQLTSTALSDQTDIDYQNVTYVLSTGSKGTDASGDKALNAFEKAIYIKASDTAAGYFYNKTALKGDIKKFEVFINDNIGNGATINVSFGTSALTTASQESGTVLTDLKGEVLADFTIAQGSKFFRIDAPNKNLQVQIKITLEEGGVTPAEKYSVTYKANGGTGDDHVVSNIEAGSSHQLLTAEQAGFTAPSNKQFAGWRVNNQGDVLQPGASLTISANTDIYAQWEEKSTPQPETYTVSFNANGGTGTMSAVNDISGEYTLPNNGFTAPDNKEFAGWKVNNQGDVLQPGAKIQVSANVTLYAQWKEVVTPTEKTLVSIEVVAPNKTQYFVDDKLDLTGLKVILHYSDGSSEEITDLSKLGAISIDTSRPGEKVVTITFEGKTATFKVNVTRNPDVHDGCHCSIIAGSALLSITTLLGAGLLMLRKRKEK